MRYIISLSPFERTLLQKLCEAPFYCGGNVQRIGGMELFSEVYAIGESNCLRLWGAHVPAVNGVDIFRMRVSESPSPAAMGFKTKLIKGGVCVHLLSHTECFEEVSLRHLPLPAGPLEVIAVKGIGFVNESDFMGVYISSVPDCVELTSEPSVYERLYSEDCSIELL